MIHTIHQTIFYFHVIIGTLALIVFWLPLVTTKGSNKHKQSGKIFAWSMYVVSISGLLMTIIALAMPLETYAINPELSAAQISKAIEQIRFMNSFLFMLSLLVFCTTHHALKVVEFKNNRSAMRTIHYLTPLVLLGVSGIILLVVGISDHKVLYMVFGGVSISASYGMLKYVLSTSVANNQWLIEHFSGLIGSGIGAYTAFFAFGGRRILNHIFVDYLQLIPWIAPSVIGVSFTIWLTKKYSRKNGTNNHSSSNSLSNDVANEPLGKENFNTSSSASH